MATLTVVGSLVVGGAELLARPQQAVIQRVTVAAGDTVWTIAERAQPDADTQAVVRSIEDLNGLQDDLVWVGEVLQVPRVVRS